MDWPFGVVKFVRPQTPPIVELLVISDLKTTSQSVLVIHRLNKTRVESVQLGKTSKRLWSCQTLISVLFIIFYKEKNDSWVKKKNLGSKKC